MKQVTGWVILAIMMFLIGTGIGLLVSWGVMPVRMVDTAPRTLQQADKDRYRSLIALDHLVTDDDERAIMRMGLLDDTGALAALSNQINRRAWASEAEGLALARLNSELIDTTTNQSFSTAVQLTPILSTAISAEAYLVLETKQTANPTLGITVAVTNSVAPGPFVLLNRTPICKVDQVQPVLEITVVDMSGKPIGGVVIVISSAEVTERLITGLNPGKSTGVADSLMKVGMKYVISLEGRSGSSENISTSECTSPAGELFTGGWSVQIQY